MATTTPLTASKIDYLAGQVTVHAEGIAEDMERIAQASARGERVGEDLAGIAARLSRLVWQASRLDAMREAIADPASA
jgi:hypothetical protein